jgi:hypothetical protein
MELAAGNNKAWRRRADELEATARSMTRTAALLALMTFVAVAYGVSAQARYSGICERLQDNAPQTQSLLKDFARTLSNEYCQ